MPDCRMNSPAGRAVTRSSPRRQPKAPRSTIWVVHSSAVVAWRATGFPRKAIPPCREWVDANAGPDDSSTTAYRELGPDTRWNQPWTMGTGSGELPNACKPRSAPSPILVANTSAKGPAWGTCWPSVPVGTGPSSASTSPTRMRNPLITQARRSRCRLALVTGPVLVLVPSVLT